MDRFLELVEKGVIIQRVIAGTLIGIAAYLWVAQGAIPESLKACLFIVLGFFFSNELSATIIKYLIDELRRR